MGVKSKICGLSTVASVTAATEGGADYVGFVFYPPSPRNLTPDQAAALITAVPENIKKVGVFVNPTDDDLQQVLDHVSLDMIQLHGNESPDRVREISRRLPTLKAIAVHGPEDIKRAQSYVGIAQMILFDSKPPKNGLPGGNGLLFDWELLKNIQLDVPWMLSGGLETANVAEAIKISGATIVDVSSGVEDSPGAKNPEKIKKFLDEVKKIS